MVQTGQGVQSCECLLFVLQRDGLISWQQAVPVLIGTKYDLFVSLPREQQEEITNQAKRFAQAMRAPLVCSRSLTRLTLQIFCSTSLSINVNKIFKIVLARAFDLKVRTLLQFRG